ncbi:hypothetical protein B0H14DRAFT_3641355 [Mycena olivaceomarginata]|nr:hypothetical protein B0H14DRAFT_3641355 [Mycena olivaceomarginata]
MQFPFWDLRSGAITAGCTCESLKFHSCHLCKHLVQGVPPPPPRFWTEAVRRRTAPLYRPPALVPLGEESSAYIEMIDGSITDGDDHGWSGNPEMLEGGAAGETSTSRHRACLESARGHQMPARTQRIWRRTHRALFPSSEAQDSDDEEEVEDMLRTYFGEQMCSRRQRKFCAHRFRTGTGFGCQALLSETSDAMHEFTAQTRDTTWPKKGDKEGQRRSQNTMGYQVGL